MSRPAKSIFLIAGEASGDLHGANVVRAIRRMDPDIAVTGIGGAHLRDAGMETLIDASALSVVGITEVIAHLPVIFSSLAAVKRALRERRPDLVLLIDYPDFNLRVARMAKGLGIPVFYYISPQIWAWRENRVRTIARRIDHMAVILPFEADFYKKHGVPVTFVGHPLMDTPLGAEVPRERPLEGPAVIGLLPGSRTGEIRRLLPVMIESARRIAEHSPATRFLLSRAPGVEASLLRALLPEGFPVEIADDLSDVFRQAALVVAASGTVTLQSAIQGIPMIIVYKVSPISYRLGKWLIKVPHIGLINLIAGRKIVPELIQDEADGPNIAQTALRMLGDPLLLQTMRNDLLEARRILGGPGASERAARIALSFLEHRP
ncbi:lipid-A-disaccharide synthase [Desulfatirhabdium butyrativorans]|uniref:lipid-A-disaccharide synthase n=1 Tax=Desulfatirhabdium butyrativorans TaxID=340467 RepID=UPI00040578B4|nr:lipid-A-disaccharide synthase [Desulfatirhabdium butyrativorans]